MATYYMTAESELYHTGFGYDDKLMHYGVLGMKWGVRRYQNPDGTLTSAGKQRYGTAGKKLTEEQKKSLKYYKKQLKQLKNDQKFFDYATKKANAEYDNENKKYERLNAKTEKKFSNSNMKRSMSQYYYTAAKDAQRATYKNTADKNWKKIDSLVNEMQSTYGTSRVPTPKSKIYKDGRRVLMDFDKSDMLKSILLGGYGAYGTAGDYARRYQANAEYYNFNKRPTVKRTKLDNGSVDYDVNYSYLPKNGPYRPNLRKKKGG